MLWLGSGQGCLRLMVGFIGLSEAEGEADGGGI